MALNYSKNTTTLKKEIFSFTWNIEEFGEFMDRKYEIASPIFVPENSDDTKWKLIAFPEDVYPEGSHVTVRILKACDDDKSCSAKYTISVIDNSSKILQQKTREKVFRHHLDFDDCLVISNRALRENIFLQNGTLIISCKIDLVVAINPDDTLFSESKLPSYEKVALPANNLSYEKSPTGPVKFQRNIGNLSDFNNSLLTVSTGQNVGDGENLKSRKSLELLSSDLESLYMNKTASDIILRTDDGEIRAHKAILITRSDYFKRMLNSQYSNEVYVPGIKSITFDAVLYYLYTGQLRHLTFELALDLSAACNTFSLNQLQNTIQNYLKTQININNVTDILRKSKEFNMDILKNAALKFVSANQSDIAKSEKWNQMMRNDPHTAGEVLLTVASFQKNRKW